MTSREPSAVVWTGNVAANDVARGERVITLQQRSLEAQAVTDPLTGLGNRTRLRDTLEEAIEHSRCTGSRMTLVSLDLDHFKAINDSLGHDGGDTVLRGVADVLRRRMRRADKVFRLGGEEFLALLYGTDAENGRRVADELRAVIESLQLLPDQPVTVSTRDLLLPARGHTLRAPQVGGRAETPPSGRAPARGGSQWNMSWFHTRSSATSSSTTRSPAGPATR